MNIHIGLHGAAKAYACTNCMEFFAELSVAFLWQKDSIKELDNYDTNEKINDNTDNTIINAYDIEYNKWYPHNYIQLFDHDIETCKMLSSIWKIPMQELLISDIKMSEYEMQNTVNRAKAQIFDLIFKCKKTNKFSIMDVDTSGVLSSVVTTEDLYYTIN